MISPVRLLPENPGLKSILRKRPQVAKLRQIVFQEYQDDCFIKKEIIGVP